jgi:hypothetical protein
MRNHGPFLLLIVVILGWRVKIIIGGCQKGFTWSSLGCHFVRGNLSFPLIL